MILNEVLNTPVKFKWLHNEAGMAMARFMIGNDEVNVEFHEMENPLNSKEADPTAPKLCIDISFNVSENGDYDSAEYGITGNGGEYQIFATVVLITKEFISTHKPDGICFSAAEPSRIKLYDRFVKRFTGMGYKLWKRARHSSKDMFWVLVKK